MEMDCGLAMSARFSLVSLVLVLMNCCLNHVESFPQILMQSDRSVDLRFAICSLQLAIYRATARRQHSERMAKSETLVQFAYLARLNAWSTIFGLEDQRSSCHGFNL